MTATATHSKSVKDLAFGDIHREFKVTRKVLERLPEDKFDWKVHEKSMSLGRLAMHVATLPEWMLGTIRADDLDMANPPKMKIEAADKADLLKTFDDCSTATIEALARMNDHELEKTWSLKQGAQVLHADTKANILRV